MEREGGGERGEGRKKGREGKKGGGKGIGLLAIPILVSSDAAACDWLL